MFGEQSVWGTLFWQRPGKHRQNMAWTAVGDWFGECCRFAGWGSWRTAEAALQEKLANAERGENNSYYDDIVSLRLYIGQTAGRGGYAPTTGGLRHQRWWKWKAHSWTGYIKIANNINANELARQKWDAGARLWKWVLAQSQANSIGQGWANIYAQAQKDAYNAYLQQIKTQQQQDQWQWEKDRWQKEFELNCQQHENELRHQMDQDEWNDASMKLIQLEMGDYGKLASMYYNGDYLKRCSSMSYKSYTAGYEIQRQQAKPYVRLPGGSSSEASSVLLAGIDGDVTFYGKQRCRRSPAYEWRWHNQNKTI